MSKPFQGEIAVYPGSANDFGPVLGLYPKVKTFLFINDARMTKLLLRNNGFAKTCTEVFGAKLIESNDVYDTFFNRKLGLTFILIKNCIWPNECTVPPMIASLIARATQQIQINTFSNPEATSLMSKDKLVLVSSVTHAGVGPGNFDEYSEGQFSSYIILAGKPYESYLRTRCRPGGWASEFVCNLKTPVKVFKYKNFADFQSDMIKKSVNDLME